MSNSKLQISRRRPQSLKRKCPVINNRIIFIVGPTAMGKTGIAVKIAKKINAEIISCDSMQIYRGMDILSSMPSVRLRREVKHHLIRFLKPDKEYNVAKYRAQAVGIIKRIRRKAKVPLFVGGTGQYMSILIDGLFKARSQNKSIRSGLYQLAHEKGDLYLHKYLRKIDPLAAGKIHPHDTRRVVRALEVYKTMGRPISELQKERKGLSQENKIKIYCLNMDRERLYQRIDQRITKMFRQGLVSEVRRLSKMRLSRTASHAIGIPEIKGYLNGDYDLTQARQLIQRNSCRLAKRQLTWFRKDKRIEWIITSPQETSRVLVKRIQEKLREW
jgi:tRNA dimethylallyltransferase